MFGGRRQRTTEQSNDRLLDHKNGLSVEAVTKDTFLMILLNIEITMLTLQPVSGH